MEKEKKLNLMEIKVKSFTTTLDMPDTLDRDEQKWIKGGSKTEGGTTSPPIFC
jgi:hypothetical protein